LVCVKACNRKEDGALVPAYSSVCEQDRGQGGPLRPGEDVLAEESVAQGDADVGDGGCEGYAGHSLLVGAGGCIALVLVQDGILTLVKVSRSGDCSL